MLDFVFVSDQTVGRSHYGRITLEEAESDHTKMFPNVESTTSVTTNIISANPSPIIYDMAQTEGQFSRRLSTLSTQTSTAYATETSGENNNSSKVNSEISIIPISKKTSSDQELNTSDNLSSPKISKISSFTAQPDYTITSENPTSILISFLTTQNEEQINTDSSPSIILPDKTQTTDNVLPITLINSPSVIWPDYTVVTSEEPTSTDMSIPSTTSIQNTDEENLASGNTLSTLQIIYSSATPPDYKVTTLQKLASTVVPTVSTFNPIPDDGTISSDYPEFTISSSDKPHNFPATVSEEQISTVFSTTESETTAYNALHPIAAISSSVKPPDFTVTIPEEFVSTNVPYKQEITTVNFSPTMSIISSSIKPTHYTKTSTEGMTTEVHGAQTLGGDKISTVPTIITDSSPVVSRWSTSKTTSGNNEIIVVYSLVSFIFFFFSSH